MSWLLEGDLNKKKDLTFNGGGVLCQKGETKATTLDGERALGNSRAATGGRECGVPHRELGRT